MDWFDKEWKEERQRQEQENFLEKFWCEIEIEQEEKEKKDEKQPESGSN